MGDETISLFTWLEEVQINIHARNGVRIGIPLLRHPTAVHPLDRAATSIDLHRLYVYI